MSNRRPKFVATLAILGSLSMQSACGGSSEQKKVEVSGATPKDANAVGLDKPVLPLPAKIDQLVKLVPEDAISVVHIDPQSLVVKGSDGKMPVFSQETVTAHLAEFSNLPVSFMRELLPAVKSAIFFTMPNESNSDVSVNACLGLEIQDEKHFNALLEHLSAQRNPDGSIEVIRNDITWHGVWLAASHMALGCDSRELLEGALRVGNEKAPSFTALKRYQAKGESRTWATVDLHRFSAESRQAFEDGSYLSASVPRYPPTHIDLRFVGRGPRYPQLAETIVATNHMDLPKFPLGATALFGLSLERTPGKSVLGIANELARLGRARSVEDMQDALEEMGLDLNELDTLIGPEISVGVYADPKFTGKSEDVFLHKAALFSLRTVNDATSKKVWRLLMAQLKENKHGPKKTFSADSVSIELRNGNFARIERRSRIVLMGIGEKSFIEELAVKFDSSKATFASNGDFEAARRAAKPSHFAMYIDFANLLSLAGKPVADDLFNQIQEKPDFLTLTLGPTPGGMDVALHSPFSTAGVISALGVYGVSRYLKAAKVSEAKNAVGRISRSAAEAFERESDTADHALCGSAVPVPSTVPKGVKYMPANEAGRDFMTGTQLAGWRCLRFKIDEPLRYQYEYRFGGNYKGPARGGPDPGPNGFEASAEGDLDGDGKTSLFTLTGQVQNGMLVRSTQIFIVDEFE